jgi:hypothetical protein
MFGNVHAIPFTFVGSSFHLIQINGWPGCPCFYLEADEISNVARVAVDGGSNHRN